MLIYDKFSTHCYNFLVANFNVTRAYITCFMNPYLHNWLHHNKITVHCHVSIWFSEKEIQLKYGGIHIFPHIFSRNTFLLHFRPNFEIKFTQF